MICKLKWLCLPILLIFTQKNLAQECSSCNTDSLYQQVSQKKSDSEKMKALETVVFNFNFNYTQLNFNKVISELISLNKKTKKINEAPYLAYLAGVQFHLQKKDQLALLKLNEAIEGFDKEKKIIIGLLSYVRQVYNSLNQQEERYQFYTAKLKYYRINGPVENTAACYHGLGGYFVYKANYDQAISAYLKAAELYKAFHHVNYLNDIAVVGVTYSHWGNLDKALYYLLKTLPHMRKTPNPGLRSYALVALSDVSLKRKDYRNALAYADEAIDGFANKRLTRYYAVSTLQKAIIYLKLHKAAEAYPYLTLSKSVCDTVRDGHKLLNAAGEFEADFAWYLYNKEINQKAAANTALLIAYKKAVNEKSTDFQLKYLRELAQWYTNQNRGVQARLYLQKYYALQDAIEMVQSKANIAHYETEQAEQRQTESINILKQEKAVQAALVNKSRTIAIISLTALLFICAAMFFVYRQWQINKKTLTKLQTTQTQLIQAEKMASLGELTAGIAHEIQNPLNFVNNFSDLNREMLDELNEELNKGDIAEAKAIAVDIKQNEEKINHHGKRADAIVKGMLEHSRVGTGPKEFTDINKLADEYLRLAYHGLRAKDKFFNAELILLLENELPPVLVVPQDIGRVLLNLFNNAFYAVNQKAKTAGTGFNPQVSIATTVAGGSVSITVKDNGPGIPDAIKEKIMQPFFTTKPTGEGTGLGLSLSYDIVVKGHNGSIRIGNAAGEGAEFVVNLPIN